MTSAPKYSDELIASMNQFFADTQPTIEFLTPEEKARLELWERFYGTDDMDYAIIKQFADEYENEKAERIMNADYGPNQHFDTEEDDTEPELEEFNHNPSDHKYVRGVGHVIFFEPINDYVPADLFKEWTKYEHGYCRHCDNTQKFCYERKHGIEEDNESDEELDTEYDNESVEEFDSKCNTEYDTEYDNDYDNEYDHNFRPENDFNNESDYYYESEEEINNGFDWKYGEQKDEHFDNNNNYYEENQSYNDDYEYYPRFDDNDYYDDDFNDDNNYDDYYDDYNDYTSDDYSDGIT